MYMNKHIVEKTLLFALILFLTLLFLFPIYWAWITSLEYTGQILKLPPEFFPTKFTLGNYIEVFAQSHLGRMFFNSVFVSLTTVIAAVGIAALAGYGFSRYKFRGRVTWIYTIIIVRMIPTVVFIVPYYVIFQKLGLLDTLFGLIIVYVTSAIPFAIWLFIGFYDEIPTEVYEAAIIDGCGEFSLYHRIALPLVVPGVVVASILTFLAAYNEFGISLVLIFSDINKTLPLGISSLIRSQKDTPFGSLAAAGTIAMIPSILLSLTTQKYIVEGLTAGAVKG
jgi:ABC-type glycerol-3-phosphate transport system permease component